MCLYRVVGKKRPKDATLPEGWQRFTDGVSGKEYYHHAESGRTQWEHPAAKYVAWMCMCLCVCVCVCECVCKCVCMCVLCILSPCLK